MMHRALILVLAVAIAPVGCSRPDAPHATSTSSPSTTPASPSPVASAAPTPARNRFPEEAMGVVAIPSERYLEMWEEPARGGADYVLDAKNPNPAGGRTSPLLVDERTEKAGEEWVRILLPMRPNGSSGWARASDVKLKPVFERVVVDLSQRSLRHFVRGELVTRLRVGIGAPQYPTGVGTFYVWQRVPFSDASGPYGIFALGLSGFSPVLSDWPGEGRMAIHGTADASDRGREVSHGCVRVYNEDLRALLDVPLGTPVIIRP